MTRQSVLYVVLSVRVRSMCCGNVYRRHRVVGIGGQRAPIIFQHVVYNLLSWSRWTVAALYNDYPFELELIQSLQVCTICQYLCAVLPVTEHLPPMLESCDY